MLLGTTDPELWRELHKTIKQVTEDTESIDKMNTAISQMMIFVNSATQAKSLSKETLKIFLASALALCAAHCAGVVASSRRNRLSLRRNSGPHTTHPF